MKLLGFREGFFKFFIKNIFFNILQGRCRAKGARALLLTCEINIKEKEEQNALRERLMHSALEELSKWSQTTFKLRVRIF